MWNDATFLRGKSEWTGCNWFFTSDLTRGWFLFWGTIIDQSKAKATHSWDTFDIRLEIDLNEILFTYRWSIQIVRLKSSSKWIHIDSLRTGGRLKKSFGNTHTQFCVGKSQITEKFFRINGHCVQQWAYIVGGPSYKGKQNQRVKNFPGLNISPVSPQLKKILYLWNYSAEKPNFLLYDFINYNFSLWNSQNCQ